MMTLIGFLRGINVGGRHKAPMEELRNKLKDVGCNNVKTLLNTGNFVFETKQASIQDLENKIEDYISESFGFSIPVIIRTREEILNLVDSNPFENIHLHKDIRCYVSFLKDPLKVKLDIPYFSIDKTVKIISIKDTLVLSVLDLWTTNSSKGMNNLEKLFGKNMTTRNWNTIKKVIDV